MVAAACALRVLGAGLHSYGFTVFFLPLSQDLDLNRTSTSLAFSLARAEGAVEGPIVGHLLDRYGPKPIMLVAVLLMGVGYLLLSQVSSYAAFLLVYLGVISLSHAGGFMHAPMVLINTWFIRHRARAITISSAAFGMGGVLIAPLLSLIVHAWGWRWGAAVAGVLFLLIGLPLGLTIRRSPESMGLLPDGDSPVSAESGTNGSMPRTGLEVNVTVAEALRSFAFWGSVLAAGIRNGSYQCNRGPLYSAHGLEGTQSSGGGVPFERLRVSRYGSDAGPRLVRRPSEQAATERGHLIRRSRGDVLTDLRQLVLVAVFVYWLFCCG